jgi:DNA-directed RNA polymerase subunit RPC12/RpoP
MLLPQLFMSASPSLSTPGSIGQSPSDRLPWQEQQGPRLYSIGRAVPRNTIRFKCVDCGRQMEARSQDGGVDTNCPHCSAPLTVPRIPGNPYLRPIKHVLRQMKSVPFPFPYVPQVVQLIVLASMLLLFAGLFVTIGLVSQIAGVFRGLIVEAQKHLREGSAVERSAQAVSIGIFSLLFVPFWLVQLPFSLIGSLWSSHRLGALLTTVALLSVIYAITLYSPYLIRFLHSF